MGISALLCSSPRYRRSRRPATSSVVLPSVHGRRVRCQHQLPLPSTQAEQVTWQGSWISSTVTLASLLRGRIATRFLHAWAASDTQCTSCSGPTSCCSHVATTGRALAADIQTSSPTRSRRRRRDTPSKKMARDDDSDASSVSKSKSRLALQERREGRRRQQVPLAQPEPEPLAAQEGPLPQQIKEA